jgi:hypothetical protein
MTTASPTAYRTSLPCVGRARVWCGRLNYPSAIEANYQTTDFCESAVERRNNVNDAVYVESASFSAENTNEPFH